MSMLLLYVCVVTAVLIGRNASTCAAQSYQDERNLLDHLFDPKLYRKSIRPVSNRSDVLQVNFTQDIRLIDAVDVQTAEICTLSYLTMSWFDEFLRWNKSNFGGISVIDLPEESYWYPMLDQSSSETCGDTEREPVTAKVSSSGLVVLNVIKYTSGFCTIDMVHYPFDEHVCYYIFYDLKYTDIELLIRSMENNLTMQSAIRENQEWIVKSTNSYNYTYKITNYGKISGVSNILEIRRRPGFVIVNFFCPVWLLSLLNLCVPLVPPDTGERLSFAVTLCLAMMFVSMALITDIPRNSLNLSMWSWTLMAINIMFTFGIIWSIFIIGLSKLSKESTTIPLFIRKRIEKMSKQNDQDFDETGTTANKVEDIFATDNLPQTSKHKGRSVLTNDCQTANRITSSQQGLTNDIGWYEVSRYLDRIYFIISLILGIMMFVVIIFIFGGRILE